MPTCTWTCFSYEASWNAKCFTTKVEKTMTVLQCPTSPMRPESKHKRRRRPPRFHNQLEGHSFATEALQPSVLTNIFQLQLRINPSQSIAENVTLRQWRCGRQLAQEKTTTETLKMPRVCLCVLCCVCVLLSFPYSMGSQHAWGPDHGQGGCLSAFGRANGISCAHCAWLRWRVQTH